MSELPRLNIDELDYIFGYFPELSPSFLALSTLLRGYRFEHERAPRYLELGFGQGVSLNVHAAACRGDFWGNDFSPSHVKFARTLAGASGVRATLLEESFQQMAARDDLPEFDIIALHGIWTWIPTQARAAIIDIVRRKLAPGGLLYVSYNCLTSWAPLMPLRRLMLTHVRADPVDRPLTDKVRAALDFAQTLISEGAQHFRSNPIVGAHLESLRNRNDAYLAHEFFAHAWEPTSFADVADQFGEAGLTFAGTAALMENIDAFSLSEAGRRISTAIDDPVLRECVRECFMNTHFRKDLFIKQPSRMTVEEQEEALLSRRFVLSAPPDMIPLQASGPMGSVMLDARYFTPLLSALASDNYAPKTVAHLCKAVGASSTRDVADQLSALVCGTYAHVAPMRAADDEIVKRCQGLNQFILDHTAQGGQVRVLASGTVGGAVRVTHLEQLFLRAMGEGASTPEGLAASALGQIERAGLSVAGERAEIVGAAGQFLTGRAHVLRSLGILQD